MFIIESASANSLTLLSERNLRKVLDENEILEDEGLNDQTPSVLRLVH